MSLERNVLFSLDVTPRHPILQAQEEELMDTTHDMTPLTLVHDHIREVLDLHYTNARIELLSTHRAHLSAIAKCDGAKVSLTLIYNPPCDATRSTHEQMRRSLAQIAATNTPHLPRLRDYMWLSDGSAALICEPLDGITLSALLAQQSSLDVTEALDIAWQLSIALERLHAAGTYHGELFPDDVILTPTARPGRYRVMLGSFGLTCPHKWFGGLAAKVRPYASPEVIFRSSPGPSADLYSLGVILHELLTGKLPFKTPARFSHVWERRATSLSSLELDDPRARELDELLGDLLEFEPFDRPRQTDALQRRLRALLARGEKGTDLSNKLPRGQRMPSNGPDQREAPRRAKLGAGCTLEDRALLISWGDQEQRVEGIADVICSGKGPLSIWGQTSEGLIFKLERGEEHVTFIGALTIDLDRIKPLGDGSFAIATSARSVFALVLGDDEMIDVIEFARPTHVTHVAGTGPNAPFAIARSGGVIEVYDLRVGVERPTKTIRHSEAKVTSLCMLPNDHSLGVIYGDGRFERIAIGREYPLRLSGLKFGGAITP